MFGISLTRNLNAFENECVESQVNLIDRTICLLENDEAEIALEELKTLRVIIGEYSVLPFIEI